MSSVIAEAPQQTTDNTDDVELIFLQLEVGNEMSGGQNNPRGIRLSDIELMMVAIAARMHGCTRSQYIIDAVNEKLARDIRHMNVPDEERDEFITEYLNRYTTK